MRNLISSMGVSLDGFIAGPGGEIDWSAPDDELRRSRPSRAMRASPETGSPKRCPG